MRYILLLFAALLATPLLAQTELPPPRLMITESDGKQRPLGLSQADINVRIAGPLAQTTLTLTFKNDTSRVLQGDLDFPLPEGATISGYGLDVNGQIVDGVPVEKEKARVAFEKEVRKGADPGLVEATVGNNFRTRVYPIPANGTRTIKVQYVNDMLASGGDLVYRVPLKWNQTLPLANLTIETDQTGTFPALKFGDRTQLLTFSGKDDHYSAHKTFENATFDNDLEIRIRDANVRPLTMVEPFTRTSLGEAETYFVVSDTPPLPLQAKHPRTSAQRIGLVYDASLSRRSGNLNRERQVLHDLFRALGNVTVDVTVLRNEAEPTRTFTVTGGDSTAILSVLKQTVFDGGTQLGVAPFPTNTPDGRRYDFHLFLSDGLGNLGKAMPFPSAVPVYVINASTMANHALLRHVAERSGGSYLNLDRVSDTQAVASIGTAAFSLISVNVTSGSVKDIFPNGQQEVQGRMLLTGRLLTDNATLRLNYGTAGKISFTQTIVVRRNGDNGSGMAGQFWAQRKADDLALLPDLNKEWLLSLGKDFNIVTPNTSLMVLERLDQYVEHHITPPKSAPELYAAYQAQQQNTEVSRKSNEKDKLTQVLAMWKQQVDWWQHKYPSGLTKEPKLLRGPVGVRGNRNSVIGANVTSLQGRGSTADVGAGVAVYGDAPDGVRDRRVQANTRSLGVNGVAPATLNRGSATATRPIRHEERASTVLATPAPRAANGVAGGRVQANVTVNTVKAGDAQVGGEAVKVDVKKIEDMGTIVATDRATAFRPTHRESNAVALSGVGGGGIPGGGGREGVARESVLSGSTRQLQAAVGPKDLTFDEIDEAKPELGAVYKAKARQFGEMVTASIAIKSWSPDTPYLKAMKTAGTEAYAVYLTQREKYATSPAFYLDCASYLLQHGQTKLGVRVLTNILELKLDNAQLTRIVAHRLEQLERRDLAIGLFTGVTKMRPEEPQSWRDLSLAYANRADSLMLTQPEQAKRDYQQALTLLNKVVMGHWDRFEGIETIALMEANRIITHLQRLPGGQAGKGGFVIPFDKRLIQNLDCDLRIVMTWDSDNSDMDLWVDEPTGERCMYSYNRTVIGGHLSTDFTQGYGPEEYCLHHAPKGGYKIRTNYFGDREQALTGGTTVQATVYTNYGRPTEKKQTLTLRLTTSKETVDIGTASIP